MLSLWAIMQRVKLDPLILQKSVYICMIFHTANYHVLAVPESPKKQK